MSHKDFLIRMIDVSRYQDKVDTPYKPTFEKVAKAGFLGVAIRVGYGLVLDTLFRWFWKVAKGILHRKPYWYLDYYSHRGTSTTDTEWGIEQAHVCYEALKDDFGEMPLALDCEDSKYGGSITLLNKGGYNKIAKAFRDEWFKLTGRICEIYCSPGFMWVFEDWAKDCDLWLAWYNRWMTKAYIFAEIIKHGWRGTIRMWQYTNDGDINDDGTPDGLQLGMETNALDLNVFVPFRDENAMEEFSLYCGSTPPPVTPPGEDEPTVPYPTYGSTKIIELKTVKCSSGLNIRKSPNVIPTNIVGYLAGGQKDVEILEVINSGQNIWARVGQAQFAAILYNGIRYME